MNSLPHRRCPHLARCMPPPSLVPATLLCPLPHGSLFPSLSPYLSLPSTLTPTHAHPCMPSRHPLPCPALAPVRPLIIHRSLALPDLERVAAGSQTVTALWPPATLPHSWDRLPHPPAPPSLERGIIGSQTATAW
jgi:hypothetical protein